MENYKSVLVKNNTIDCQVTLYIYSRYDPVCWLSFSSKILRPGVSHLHRSKKEFKFKIKTIDKSSKKKTVFGVRKWTRDTHITIYNREFMKESDLENHALEKTICIRKLNVGKEASLDEGRNLYEILKLDFEDIRKLDKNEQDEQIKKAFQREIRRWHSDIAGERGDNEMAREVLFAYGILRDREKRAEYHNKADYSKGWLSMAKWNSIFWTECETKEQRYRYRKRLFMMGLSCLFVVGGTVLSVLTWGATAPALMVVCQVLGQGFIGGGGQSLTRTISRKCIEKGCDIKDYAKSFGLGFTAGVVSGGANIGIAAGIAGIRSACLQANITKFWQNIDTAIASGATRRVAFSIAVDVEKKCVDGVDLTWKQVAGNALVGAVIGRPVGMAVGAVAGGTADMSAEVSATNIEAWLAPGMRRVAVSVAKKVSIGVTDRTTAGHVANKISVNWLMRNADLDIHLLYKEQERRQKVRCDLDKNNSLPKWNDWNVRATCNPPAQTNERENVRVRHNMDDSPENIITCARFRYIPEGPWISKMIVEYIYNGISQKEETTIHTNTIKIPIHAEDVKVYFKVMRFILTWCDVKKWDRYQKKWYKESHIFKYERPPEQRTFTLGGPLYFEGVINVTNETHDDVREM